MAPPRIFAPLSKKFPIVEPSVAEAKQSKNMTSKSIGSFVTVVVLVALFVGLSLMVPALPTLWDASKTFTFLQYSQLETIYIILLVCGHIALAIIAYAKSVLMKTNAIAAEIIVLVGAVSMALFYGVARILLKAGIKKFMKPANEK